MCGIAGIWASHHTGAIDTACMAMTKALAHRGPDDHGMWIDEEAGVALGHQRLSVIDLSSNGAQPMSSPNGNLIIVYNGEIYNFQSIRSDLKNLGHTFHGGSDTEVLLAAINQWGLERALKRCIGMFAFALWDRAEKSLTLVRDRLGIKPLYYGTVGSKILFGSELKALKAHPEFLGRIDQNALALFFRMGNIPAPYSIYEGVSKLKPGTMAKFKPDVPKPEITTYWSARSAWERGGSNPFAGGFEEAAQELESTLWNAVKLRMLSDVPIGAFLSGGIDSSTIAAIMQAQSSRPIKTFCVGFHEKEFNEAEYAKKVARHLGTDHTEMYLSPQDMLDIVPSIPRYWDEPFADPSQIPTHCISRLAQKQVTVCLSGDGGDEIFTGYSRYFHLEKWRYVEQLPHFIRSLAAWLIPHLPGLILRPFGRLAPHIRLRADTLSMRHFSEFYQSMTSQLHHPTKLVLNSQEPMTELTDPNNRIAGDRYQNMTFWDTINYLPNDILTKVDRASMAVGLEVRTPLLDHRIVELAASFPTYMKVEGKKGKRILRHLLCKYIPNALIDRPKIGFGVPIKHWMANELREWCEDLFSPSLLRSQGLLNVDMVQGYWKKYLNGDTFFVHHLWNVAIFQAWLEEEKR